MNPKPVNTPIKTSEQTLFQIKEHKTDIKQTNGKYLGGD